MRKAKGRHTKERGCDWVVLQMFTSSDNLVQELSSASCSHYADATIYFDRLAGSPPKLLQPNYSERACHSCVKIQTGGMTVVWY
jgi:hypothetical protein